MQLQPARYKKSGQPADRRHKEFILDNCLRNPSRTFPFLRTPGNGFFESKGVAPA